MLGEHRLLFMLHCSLGYLLSGWLAGWTEHKQKVMRTQLSPSDRNIADGISENHQIMQHRPRARAIIAFAIKCLPLALVISHEGKVVFGMMCQHPCSRDIMDFQ